MSDIPNGLAGALREAQLDVTENAPLAPLTTFRIGGHARMLVTAHSPEEVVRAVRLAVETGARWAVIGGGSNLLVADEGFPGVVVLVRAARVSLHDTELEAEAGAELGRIVTGSAWAGLGDLTFCAGIPGTVGGAVAGNAGAWGRGLGELVVAVRLLRAASMETVEVSREAMDFGYRRSAVQATGDVILAVRLGLEPTERKAMLKQIDENLAKRAKRLPELPSAGSVFRNLPPVQPDGQREPAGRLLEAVGAKGYRVGDAGVTDKHANVIVNYGHARARDVAQLMAELERRVAEKFGVRLSRELRELG
ncbi:MAG: UDP-N-acetylmuramate dehydrogenase [Deltaproteobacteria bacterium]|nr:UDP-N-acetylmuramate dehydrogenase [Deltaproteobacteria bacterium]